jgi:hypothetical protein
MNMFDADNPSPLAPQREIAVNDRVSVPDGCLGLVIGFYQRASATVLVRLDAGDQREYTPADLHRLA